MTCQSTQELILQDVFAFHGNPKLMTEMDMPQSLRSIRDTHLKAGFTLIVLPIIIRLSFTQQMFSTVAFGFSLMVKASRAQNHEKTSEQPYAGSVCEFT